MLHGVDLTVHAGEHVVIFGPSGSGKSTVLRTINLLEEPSEGSVRVLGVEYGPAGGRKRGKPTELRRHVGMVFQQFNLFPHLTALHNVTLSLRSTKRMKRTEAEDRAAQALPRSGCCGSPRATRRALGRAAAARRDRARARARPEGDAVRRADLGTRPGARRRGARCDARVAESGMTMVIVTHELSFAREIGDFNVFMDEGVIAESGPRGFFDNCTNPRTKQFMAAVL